MEDIGVVVLAGNAKMHKQLRRKKRRGVFLRMVRPHLWFTGRKEFESRLASKINRDDYIVGENKSLLYLHPDLISQKNLNFFKRVIYFAGKTGDRVYARNKKGILEYLSGEGRSSIFMVLSTLLDSKIIDRSRIVVVGPKEQLIAELSSRGIEGIHVQEQGDSIGENLLKGKEALLRAGYQGEYFLIIGGDVPMVSPSSIEDFFKSVMLRGGTPDIFFGMGSRYQMKEFISSHDLDHMGGVGPNYPKKGNLNKFGIPFIDDIPIFDNKDDTVPMMMGNMLLYRTSSLDRAFINKFYSLRKMLANPLIYPYLFFNWFSPGYRAWKGRLPLSEGELLFSQKTGIDLKVVPVHPEVALDMDSYSDLRRLSALQFHREGNPRDLELDFRKYMREKKRYERKEKKMGRIKKGS